MKKNGFIAIAAVCMFIAGNSAALAAELLGSVTNQQKQPVSGAMLTLKNPHGITLAQTVSDASGKFDFKDVAPGDYQLALNANTQGYKGQTVALHLGPDGLNVDWAVSPSTPAIAYASQAPNAPIPGDPFGMSPGNFTLAVLGATGVIAGGVLGGYAAAGGFNGSNNSGNVTPAY